MAVGALVLALCLTLVPNAAAIHSDSKTKESCRLETGEEIEMTEPGALRPDAMICAKAYAKTTNVGDCFFDSIDSKWKCYYEMWQGSGGRGIASGIAVPGCTTPPDPHVCPHPMGNQDWPAHTLDYQEGENWEVKYEPPHTAQQGNPACHGLRPAATSVLPPGYTAAAQVLVSCPLNDQH